MFEPRPDYRYEKFQDKTGRTWLVRVGPHPEYHIWVESDMGNRGLGGSSMRFRLEDGSDVILIGPWNSNRQSFEEATGKKLGE
jgi:hypothetical protein